MDPPNLESLLDEIRHLSAGEQDQLAGMLLVERLKRNRFILPELSKRIDDAEPKNWKDWNNLKDGF